MSVTLLLGLAALVTAIANAVGRCPIWVPVILLAICELLRSLPLK